MQNLQAYLEHIRKDYVQFQTAMGASEECNRRMIAEFDAKLAYTVGKKYIKITSNGSAHSFVLREDSGKFRAGDILKAASWAAPATNFARGNVLAGKFSNVRWTGA